MAKTKTARRENRVHVRTQPATSDAIGDPKCTLPNICRYIEELDYWLRTRFIPDYTALRIAVCNVEKEAFSNSGVNTEPPRFCGDVATDPAPPMPFGYG